MLCGRPVSCKWIHDSGYSHSSSPLNRYRLTFFGLMNSSFGGGVKNAFKNRGVLFTIERILEKSADYARERFNSAGWGQGY